LEAQEGDEERVEERVDERVDERVEVEESRSRSKVKDVREKVWSWAGPALKSYFSRLLECSFS
jgi:hypothetical protein